MFHTGGFDGVGDADSLVQGAADAVGVAMAGTGAAIATARVTVAEPQRVAVGTQVDVVAAVAAASVVVPGT